MSKPTASVLIVGAGPTGLMLAIELGRRGVPTVLISESDQTSTTPKATVTQARTMEHYRRLGLAERVRRTGAPADHATDIVYCSRITWHELARHRLPSPDQARRWVREQPDRFHTPELTHRSSQMWIEPILLEQCRRLPSVTLQLEWRVTRFEEAADHVTVHAERVAGGQPTSFRGAFLVGCDGAASGIRRQLGIGRGESAGIREFKGRPMFSVHARAPGLFESIPFARGWLYAAVNATQRGSCISLNGTEFKFSFWRPDDWTTDEVTRERVEKLHFQMFGKACDFDIIDSKFWRGGASLVADGYRRGRVLLAGDAAHLFTPSAGLGYNTGIDDAVNLGWKLAALVAGWGGPALLESYERECRPEALRRTRFAAECAERLAVFKPSPQLDQSSPEGEAARAHAGRHFAEHLAFQYDIPGINFGARFDDSPIIAGDGEAAPEGTSGTYVPSGVPGGRAPHVWLGEGHSLYDAFGLDFTLLQLGAPRKAIDGEALCQAAAAAHVPVQLVRLPDEALRQRYEAELVLIRPDQIIAWRGSAAVTPSDFALALARVTGWGAAAR
jgi:2-polyprenyl-6-methoxyphenol hydroxylase-like FAD-dependent oxidoreductase